MSLVSSNIKLRQRSSQSESLCLSLYIEEKYFTNVDSFIKKEQKKGAASDGRDGCICEFGCR